MFSKLRFVDVSFNKYILHLRTDILHALSVQHIQRLTHDRFPGLKNDETFFKISVALMVVSRGEQKRHYSLNKPE